MTGIRQTDNERSDRGSNVHDLFSVRNMFLGRVGSVLTDSTGGWVLAFRPVLVTGPLLSVRVTQLVPKIGVAGLVSPANSWKREFLSAA
jgi:hypothetical protein